jgi:hypothetical protein
VDQADLGVVDPAREERQVGPLPAQDVEQLESVGISVLEALELLEEHDAVGGPVPVDEGP